MAYDYQGDTIGMKFNLKKGNKYLSTTVNKDNTFTLSADRSKMHLIDVEYYIFI